MENGDFITRWVQTGLHAAKTLLIRNYYVLLRSKTNGLV